MTRRQKRKIIIIAILLLLLMLVGAYFAYFNATKRLDFDFTPTTADAMQPPQYLYSFSGPDNNRMNRPLGIFVDDKEAEVYVTDSRLRKVFVFTLEGDFKRSFGGDELVIPLYVARNPVDGDIYVTDRRTRSIHIYTPDGTYLEDFEPNIPESELAQNFERGDVEWAPVAIAFAEDGTMYVTEILNGHRWVIFDKDGKFVKAIGNTGLVTGDATQNPELFQFPNSIKRLGDEVYVSDSNNRRLQVFDTEGVFDRIIVTDGLPRGFDFLARSDDPSETVKAVVVDTLAHDCTIWSVTGEKIVNFGERGVLEGQFSYPNDLSVGPKNLIFITDSANARVQVWGWPEEVTPLPVAEVAQYWKWCFAPLLLLPLLLLLRRKRFYATRDFVETMLELQLAEQMPGRRRKWYVLESDYELLKDYVQGGVNMGELLHPTEYSESDAKNLMERMEIDHATAVVLSVAQRMHVFCTEDMEYRRLAKLLELDVVDHVEFLERYASKNDGGSSSGAEGSTSAPENEEV